ncbi:MAG: hypothetical protein ND866_16700 [Pyrinomonadaceae bacterium]|nr:hypothetical protein [Pyrinomonadaceae bacterium]
MRNRKTLARATGTFRRASGWAGEKAARSGGLIRAIVGKTYTSKLGRTILGDSLRPYLGQGASRRARVGRVRSLAFLSILHGEFLSRYKRRGPPERASIQTECGG